MDSEIIPANGIILVEPLEETQAGGVLIPDTVSHKDQVGVVVAVGDPKPYDSNPSIKETTQVKVGDTVIHQTWNALALTTPMGKKRRFVRFQDITGIYKKVVK